MAVKKMSIPAIPWRGDRREKMGGPGYAEVESGREKRQRRDSLITATSLRQVELQRAERAFLRYGVMMMEGSP